ncbi:MULTISPECIES: BadF/BadG/BcrA/BcrD ATPase family protein [Nitrospirillum]|uniref:Glucosamine kinase n=1 Tax=Nitrospirillum amazonense TaxID=28077 RepID=A0A560FN97_9PROT|nr:BadF/BadG/BcrA/BcrD ATPase family protein [Nitrospirillum amazonense]MEC4594939.1 BadF/BadG/BcrA/BcrD ATPase family protein [Nitrospirillum amazonense]TWB23086.1 glucosamine kinase [Nitrospirillum amazonense]
MGDALYLGVDGGGTGCRARLEDAAGAVLGQGISGPAATRFGVEASWRAIQTAAGHALKEAGLDERHWGRVHAGVGVAGIGRPGARAGLEAMPHPYGSLAFTSDAMIACLGAHGGHDGGIVIVGTGSCAIGRVAGREVRFGGYGFPISDEGSGAYLGLRALRHALRAHDGRETGSALTRELMARFHDDPMAVVGWMDAATATDYATFAPLVVRQADQGDAVARHVVQNAAEHVNDLVRALLSAGAPRVSLIGGLATVLSAWLAPDVRRRLSPTLGDAVAGALALAGRPVG